jgi:hypothetical protein
MTIKHSVVTAQPNDPAKDVSANAWNDNHVINGGLDLPLESVPTPPANTVRLFGYKVGGRMMVAFKGPSGLESSLQPSIARNKIALWSPAGNATTVTQIGMAAGSLGTASAANVATTNIFTAMRRLDYLVTTAATTAIAALSSSGAGSGQFFRGTAPLGGFHVVLRFGGATGMATATHRFYAGMTSTAMNFTDAESSSRDNLIGVGYDSADANWQLMHKTGSGAVTKVDLGAAFPRQTADRSKMYELVIFCAPGGASVFYEFIDLTTGAVVTGEITSNLPSASQLLRWGIIAGAGGTSSVIGISVASAYVETDY